MRPASLYPILSQERSDAKLSLSTKETMPWQPRRKPRCRLRVVFYVYMYFGYTHPV
jgi:hypothetical protein